MHWTNLIINFLKMFLSFFIKDPRKITVMRLLLQKYKRDNNVFSFYRYFRQNKATLPLFGDKYLFSFVNNKIFKDQRRSSFFNEAEDSFVFNFKSVKKINNPLFVSYPQDSLVDNSLVRNFQTFPVLIERFVESSLSAKNSLFVETTNVLHPYTRFQNTDNKPLLFLCCYFIFEFFFLVLLINFFFGSLSDTIFFIKDNFFLISPFFLLKITHHKILVFFFFSSIFFLLYNIIEWFFQHNTDTKSSKIQLDYFKLPPFFSFLMGYFFDIFYVLPVVFLWITFLFKFFSFFIILFNFFLFPVVLFPFFFIYRLVLKILSVFFNSTYWKNLYFDNFYSSFNGEYSSFYKRGLFNYYPFRDNTKHLLFKKNFSKGSNQVLKNSPLRLDTNQVFVWDFNPSQRFHKMKQNPTLYSNFLAGREKQYFPRFRNYTIKNPSILNYLLFRKIYLLLKKKKDIFVFLKKKKKKRRFFFKKTQSFIFSRGLPFKERFLRSYKIFKRKKFKRSRRFFLKRRRQRFSKRFSKLLALELFNRNSVFFRSYFKNYIRYTRQKQFFEKKKIYHFFNHLNVSPLSKYAFILGNENLSLSPIRPYFPLIKKRIFKQHFPVERRLRNFFKRRRKFRIYSFYSVRNFRYKKRRVIKKNIRNFITNLLFFHHFYFDNKPMGSPFLNFSNYFSNFKQEMIEKSYNSSLVSGFLLPEFLKQTKMMQINRRLLFSSKVKRIKSSYLNNSILSDDTLSDLRDERRFILFKFLFKHFLHRSKDEAGSLSLRLHSRKNARKKKMILKKRKFLKFKRRRHLSRFFKIKNYKQFLYSLNTETDRFFFRLLRDSLSKHTEYFNNQKINHLLSGTSDLIHLSDVGINFSKHLSFIYKNIFENIRDNSLDINGVNILKHNFIKKGKKKFSINKEKKVDKKKPKKRGIRFYRFFFNILSKTHRDSGIYLPYDYFTWLSSYDELFDRFSRRFPYSINDLNRPKVYLRRHKPSLNNFNIWLLNKFSKNYTLPQKKPFRNEEEKKKAESKALLRQDMFYFAPIHKEKRRLRFLKKRREKLKLQLSKKGRRQKGKKTVNKIKKQLFHINFRFLSKSTGFVKRTLTDLSYYFLKTIKNNPLFFKADRLLLSKRFTNIPNGNAQLIAHKMSLNIKELNQKLALESKPYFNVYNNKLKRLLRRKNLIKKKLSVNRKLIEICNSIVSKNNSTSNKNFAFNLIKDQIALNNLYQLKSFILRSKSLQGKRLRFRVRTDSGNSLLMKNFFPSRRGNAYIAELLLAKRVTLPDFLYKKISLQNFQRYFISLLLRSQGKNKLIFTSKDTSDNLTQGNNKIVSSLLGLYNYKNSLVLFENNFKKLFYNDLFEKSTIPFIFKKHNIRSGILNERLRQIRFQNYMESFIDQADKGFGINLQEELEDMDLDHELSQGLEQREMEYLNRRRNAVMVFKDFNHFKMINQIFNRHKIAVMKPRITRRGRLNSLKLRKRKNSLLNKPWKMIMYFRKRSLDPLIVLAENIKGIRSDSALIAKTVGGSFLFNRCLETLHSYRDDFDDLMSREHEFLETLYSKRLRRFLLRRASSYQHWYDRMPINLKLIKDNLRDSLLAKYVTTSFDNQLDIGLIDTDRVFSKKLDSKRDYVSLFGLDVENSNKQNSFYFKRKRGLPRLLSLFRQKLLFNLQKSSKYSSVLGNEEENFYKNYSKNYLYDLKRNKYFKFNFKKKRKIFRLNKHFKLYNKSKNLLDAFFNPRVEEAIILKLGKDLDSFPSLFKIIRRESAYTSFIIRYLEDFLLDNYVNKAHSDNGRINLPLFLSILRKHYNNNLRDQPDYNNRDFRKTFIKFVDKGFKLNTPFNSSLGNLFYNIWVPFLKDDLDFTSLFTGAYESKVDYISSISNRFFNKRLFNAKQFDSLVFVVNLEDHFNLLRRNFTRSMAMSYNDNMIFKDEKLLKSNFRFFRPYRRKFHLMISPGIFSKYFLNFKRYQFLQDSNYSYLNKFNKSLNSLSTTVFNFDFVEDELYKVALDWMFLRMELKNYKLAGWKRFFFSANKNLLSRYNKLVNTVEQIQDLKSDTIVFNDQFFEFYKAFKSALFSNDQLNSAFFLKANVDNFLKNFFYYNSKTKLRSKKKLISQLKRIGKFKKISHKFNVKLKKRFIQTLHSKNSMSNTKLFGSEYGRDFFILKRKKPFFYFKKHVSFLYDTIKNKLFQSQVLLPSTSSLIPSASLRSNSKFFYYHRHNDIIKRHRYNFTLRKKFRRFSKEMFFKYFRKRNFHYKSIFLKDKIYNENFFLKSFHKLHSKNLLQKVIKFPFNFSINNRQYLNKELSHSFYDYPLGYANFFNDPFSNTNDFSNLYQKALSKQLLIRNKQIENLIFNSKETKGFLKTFNKILFKRYKFRKLLRKVTFSSSFDSRNLFIKRRSQFRKVYLLKFLLKKQLIKKLLHSYHNQYSLMKVFPNDLNVNFQTRIKVKPFFDGYNLSFKNHEYSFWHNFRLFRALNFSFYKDWLIKNYIIKNKLTANRLNFKGFIVDHSTIPTDNRFNQFLHLANIFHVKQNIFKRPTNEKLVHLLLSSIFRYHIKNPSRLYSSSDRSSFFLLSKYINLNANNYLNTLKKTLFPKLNSSLSSKSSILTNSLVGTRERQLLLTSLNYYFKWKMWKRLRKQKLKLKLISPKKTKTVFSRTPVKQGFNILRHNKNSRFLVSNKLSNVFFTTRSIANFRKLFFDNSIYHFNFPLRLKNSRDVEFKLNYFMKLGEDFLKAFLLYHRMTLVEDKFLSFKKINPKYRLYRDGRHDIRKSLERFSKFTKLGNYKAPSKSPISLLDFDDMTNLFYLITGYISKSGKRPNRATVSNRVININKLYKYHLILDWLKKKYLSETYLKLSIPEKYNSNVQNLNSIFLLLGLKRSMKSQTNTQFLFERYALPQKIKMSYSRFIFWLNRQSLLKKSKMNRLLKSRLKSIYSNSSNLFYPSILTPIPKERPFREIAPTFTSIYFHKPHYLKHFLLNIFNLKPNLPHLKNIFFRKHLNKISPLFDGFLLQSEQKNRTLLRKYFLPGTMHKSRSRLIYRNNISFLGRRKKWKFLKDPFKEFEYMPLLQKYPYLIKVFTDKNNFIYDYFNRIVNTNTSSYNIPFVYKLRKEHSSFLFQNIYRRFYKYNIMSKNITNDFLNSYFDRFSSSNSNIASPINVLHKKIKKIIMRGFYNSSEQSFLVNNKTSNNKKRRKFFRILNKKYHRYIKIKTNFFSKFFPSNAWTFKNNLLIHRPVNLTRIPNRFLYLSKKTNHISSAKTKLLREKSKFWAFFLKTAPIINQSKNSSDNVIQLRLRRYFQLLKILYLKNYNFVYNISKQDQLLFNKKLNNFQKSRKYNYVFSTIMEKPILFSRTSRANFNFFFDWKNMFLYPFNKNKVSRLSLLKKYFIDQKPTLRVHKGFLNEYNNDFVLIDNVFVNSTKPLRNVELNPRYISQAVFEKKNIFNNYLIFNKNIRTVFLNKKSPFNSLVFKHFLAKIKNSYVFDPILSSYNLSRKALSFNSSRFFYNYKTNLNQLINYKLFVDKLFAISFKKLYEQNTFNSIFIDSENDIKGKKYYENLGFLLFKKEYDDSLKTRYNNSPNILLNSKIIRLANKNFLSDDPDILDIFNDDFNGDLFSNASDVIDKNDFLNSVHSMLYKTKSLKKKNSLRLVEFLKDRFTKKNMYMNNTISDLVFKLLHSDHLNGNSSLSRIKFRSIKLDLMKKLKRLKKQHLFQYLMDKKDWDARQRENLELKKKSLKINKRPPLINYTHTLFRPRPQNFDIKLHSLRPSFQPIQFQLPTIRILEIMKSLNQTPSYPKYNNLVFKNISNVLSLYNVLKHFKSLKRRFYFVAKNKYQLKDNLRLKDSFFNNPSYDIYKSLVNKSRFRTIYPIIGKLLQFSVLDFASNKPQYTNHYNQLYNKFISNLTGRKISKLDLHLNSTKSFNKYNDRRFTSIYQKPSLQNQRTIFLIKDELKNFYLKKKKKDLTSKRRIFKAQPTVYSLPLKKRLSKSPFNLSFFKKLTNKTTELGDFSRKTSLNTSYHKSYDFLNKKSQREYLVDSKRTRLKTLRLQIKKDPIFNLTEYLTYINNNYLFKNKSILVNKPKRGVIVFQNTIPNQNFALRFLINDNNFLQLIHNLQNKHSSTVSYLSPILNKNLLSGVLRAVNKISPIKLRDGFFKKQFLYDNLSFRKRQLFLKKRRQYKFLYKTYYQDIQKFLTFFILRNNFFLNNKNLFDFYKHKPNTSRFNVKKFPSIRTKYYNNDSIIELWRPLKKNFYIKNNPKYVSWVRRRYNKKFISIFHNNNFLWREPVWSMFPLKIKSLLQLQHYKKFKSVLSEDFYYNSVFSNKPNRILKKGWKKKRKFKRRKKFFFRYLEKNKKNTFLTTTHSVLKRQLNEDSFENPLSDLYQSRYWNNFINSKPVVENIFLSPKAAFSKGNIKIPLNTLDKFFLQRRDLLTKIRKAIFAFKASTGYLYFFYKLRSWDDRLNLKFKVNNTSDSILDNAIFERTFDLFIPSFIHYRNEFVVFKNFFNDPVNEIVLRLSIFLNDFKQGNFIKQYTDSPIFSDYTGELFNFQNSHFNLFFNLENQFKDVSFLDFNNNQLIKISSQRIHDLILAEEYRALSYEKLVFYLKNYDNLVLTRKFNRFIDTKDFFYDNIHLFIEIKNRLFFFDVRLPFFSKNYYYSNIDHYSIFNLQFINNLEHFFNIFVNNLYLTIATRLEFSSSFFRWFYYTIYFNKFIFFEHLFDYLSNIFFKFKKDILFPLDFNSFYSYNFINFFQSTESYFYKIYYLFYYVYCSKLNINLNYFSFLFSTDFLYSSRIFSFFFIFFNIYILYILFIVLFVIYFVWMKRSLFFYPAVFFDQASKFLFYPNKNILKKKLFKSISNSTFSLRFVHNEFFFSNFSNTQHSLLYKNFATKLLYFSRKNLYTRYSNYSLKFNKIGYNFGSDPFFLFFTKQPVSYNFALSLYFLRFLNFSKIFTSYFHNFVENQVQFVYKRFPKKLRKTFLANRELLITKRNKTLDLNLDFYFFNKIKLSKLKTTFVYNYFFYLTNFLFKNIKQFPYTKPLLNFFSLKLKTNLKLKNFKTYFLYSLFRERFITIPLFPITYDFENLPFQIEKISEDVKYPQGISFNSTDSSSFSSKDNLDVNLSSINIDNLGLYSFTKQEGKKISTLDMKIDRKKILKLNIPLWLKLKYILFSQNTEISGINPLDYKKSRLNDMTIQWVLGFNQRSHYTLSIYEILIMFLFFYFKFIIITIISFLFFYLIFYCFPLIIFLFKFFFKLLCIHIYS